MARYVVLGNPENRRITLFQEALARRGQPPATVLAWRDLVAAEESVEAVLSRLPEAPAVLRIDSFGEDFDVERRLLRRGLSAAEADPTGPTVARAEEIDGLTFDRGRILAPRQHHHGFLSVLAELERALARRPWLRPLPSPRTIERLFDKRACAPSFVAAGAPVPRSIPSPGLTPAALRDAMRAAGHGSVFVKLACGSSASCLALYDETDPHAPWLFTSMEIDGPRLYNSLRPRRYRDRARIDRLLGFLLREGSHVEEHVPKARSDGAFFDTRMLVVEGEVAFTVMRKSRHPITNLHLGGTRGTSEELGAAVPAEVLEAAHESCRRIFAAHECLHLGVDVMFTAARDGHRVLEANAFGDLLPNLTRDGLSVYEWEIEATGRRLLAEVGIRSRIPSP